MLICPKLDLGGRITREHGKDLEPKPKKSRDKDAYIFLSFLKQVVKKLAKSTRVTTTKFEIICVGVKLSNHLVELQKPLIISSHPHWLRAHVDNTEVHKVTKFWLIAQGVI